MISKLCFNAFRQTKLQRVGFCSVVKNNAYRFVQKRGNASLKPPTQPVDLVEASVFNNLDNLTNSTTTAEPAQKALELGDFATYGLCNSTPVGLIQKLFEVIQVYGNTPMWLTVCIMTVLLRSSLIPLQILTEKQATKLHNIKPKMDVINKYIQKAKTSKDMYTATNYTMQLQELFKKNNINPLKMFILPAIQLPLMISFYMALNRISDSQLPQLSQGGALWFQNISQYDPYYILPILSSLGFIASFELNSKRGASTVLAPGAKMMIRIMPVVMILFTCKFPAIIPLYWIATSMFTVCQTYAITDKSVRKYLDIPDKVTHPKRQADESLQKKKTWYSFLTK